jgi:hypothetical protein
MVARIDLSRQLLDLKRAEAMWRWMIYTSKSVSMMRAQAACEPTGTWSPLVTFPGRGHERDRLQRSFFGRYLFLAKFAGAGGVSKSARRSWPPLLGL